MTPDQKRSLARTNDFGLEASAIRLRAAPKVSGKEQREISAAAGMFNGKALSNAEAGLNHAPRSILSIYWREYRIDFNFLINGDYAQLSADVQDALFSALEAATTKWERKVGSNRRRGTEGDRRTDA